MVGDLDQNPLAHIASSFMSASANAGPIRVVDEYAWENCGMRLFGF